LNTNEALDLFDEILAFFGILIPVRRWEAEVGCLDLLDRVFGHVERERWEATDRDVSDDTQAPHIDTIRVWNALQHLPHKAFSSARRSIHEQYSEKQYLRGHVARCATECASLLLTGAALWEEA